MGHPSTDDKTDNVPDFANGIRPLSNDLPQTAEDAGGRRAFLATFTPEIDKSIMKKVDRRFLLLIGVLYMTKNIDYTNASNVKVLQVGQSRNILKELNMTDDQYNWVQSIYFVRENQFGELLYKHDMIHLHLARSATSSLRSPAICYSRK